MLKEFKKFIARGNAIDLAIGIMIGGAFQSIVNSLVNDILMPPIGFLVGGLSFSDLKIVLVPEFTKLDGSKVAEVAWRYGSFIQVLFNFFVTALALFLLVKLYNKLHDAKLLDKLKHSLLDKSDLSVLSSHEEKPVEVKKVQRVFNETKTSANDSTDVSANTALVHCQELVAIMIEIRDILKEKKVK